jgi:hypothetical protein
MLFALLALAAAAASAAVPNFTVRHDPATHEITLRFGPFDLPRMPPGIEHHASYDAGGHDTPLVKFAWPLSGWARGFRVVIRDGNGRTLPVRLLHHLNLLDLERRQLVQPVYERIMALGQETDDVTLPRSVGVRLDSGSVMAVSLAWANSTGEDLTGVILELTVPYLPNNTSPRPRDARPAVLDVGFVAGVSNVFDLDTGRTIHQREFVMPVNGRLLVAGGHLHAMGESLSLIDEATGKVLVTLLPRMDSVGGVLGVSRKLFGVRGDGLKLSAGHRYRVVAVYHNRLGRALAHGGMGVMVGLFAPDDPTQWPAIDRSDPGFLADVAALERSAARASGLVQAHPH